MTESIHYPSSGDETAMIDSVRDTHRGWSISRIDPPIPLRSFDWQAVHPDHDGADGGCGRIEHASTREGVIAEVYAWHDDQDSEGPRP
jgi:hypothetical protein